MTSSSTQAADIVFADERAVTRGIFGGALLLGGLIVLAREVSALFAGRPSGTRPDALVVSVVLAITLIGVGALLSSLRRRVRVARRTKELSWSWSILQYSFGERRVHRDRVSALELVERRGRYRVYDLYAIVDGARRRITTRVGEAPAGAFRASTLLGVPLKQKRVGGRATG